MEPEIKRTKYPVDYDQDIMDGADTPEITGLPLTPEEDEHYVYQPERGIRKLQADDPGHWPVMTGKHLLCMNEKNYQDPETLIQSKALTRFLLGLHLPDQSMMTRQILIDLKKI